MASEFQIEEVILTLGKALRYKTSTLHPYRGSHVNDSHLIGLGCFMVALRSRDLVVVGRAISWMGLSLLDRELADCWRYAKMLQFALCDERQAKDNTNRK